MGKKTGNLTKKHKNLTFFFEKNWKFNYKTQNLTIFFEKTGNPTIKPKNLTLNPKCEKNFGKKLEIFYLNNQKNPKFGHILTLNSKCRIFFQRHKKIALFISRKSKLK